MFIYSDERKRVELLFENSLVRFIKCKYKISTNYMKMNPTAKTLSEFDKRKRAARLYAKNK